MALPATAATTPATATPAAATSAAVSRAETSAQVAPTTKEMRESGIAVVLSAEKGATKKYEGSKKTQERVESELKEKEDESWQKDKKEREDGWERQSESRGDVEEEWVGKSRLQGEGEE